MSKLDTTIENAHCEACRLHKPGVDVKQQIKDLFLEIIGEDMDYKKDEHPSYKSRVMTENQLRTELRKAVNDL